MHLVTTPISNLPVRHRNTSYFRFVNAEWFLGEVVSGDFVGPRAAAAAHLDEFAAAAFAFVLIQIPQVFKCRGIIPDVCEIFLSDLAAVKLQITAGLYLPGMGDKAEGAPPQTASRHRMKGVFSSHAPC